MNERGQERPVTNPSGISHVETSGLFQEIQHSSQESSEANWDLISQQVSRDIREILERVTENQPKLINVD